MKQTLKYSSTAKKFLQVKSLKDLSALFNLDPLHLLHIARSPVYKSFTVPKSSGGHRSIDSPGRAHMIIQKKLNRYLQHVYGSLRPQNVHGFIRREGKYGPIINIRSNASPHTGKEYVINADLKDFFHSITAERVRDMFTSEPFNLKRDLASLLAVLTTLHNKLPMGAPTSPVISNLILRSLDEKLVVLADMYNYDYTRYADDITYSGDLEPDEYFFRALKDRVQTEGFTINRKAEMHVRTIQADGYRNRS